MSSLALRRIRLRAGLVVLVTAVAVVGTPQPPTVPP
jgi:hypothetical protein